MAQGLQEATVQPGTAPQSPQHTQLQAEHTQGTQHTQQAQTTRLHSQPTESITKQALKRQIQRIAQRRQIQRNSTKEANTEKKPTEAKVDKTTRYEYRGLV